MAAQGLFFVSYKSVPVEPTVPGQSVSHHTLALVGAVIWLMPWNVRADGATPRAGVVGVGQGQRGWAWVRVVRRNPWWGHRPGRIFSTSRRGEGQRLCLICR
eukprot:365533-Chlamydomonas_euryale.AAC.8